MGRKCGGMRDRYEGKQVRGGELGEEVGGEEGCSVGGHLKHTDR